jgi:predicted ATP-grasp superfamily ATP-dependent carboligase
MAAAVERLVAAIPLVGLNSADFVVDGDDFHLLEINPRPGATFDIFEPRGGSLFALHIAACRGMLPAAPPIYDDAAAGAIVYADCDIAAMPALDWPDWTADRPIPGSSVKAEAPLCTVIAAAASVAQAKLLVERRTATILATLRARVS